MPGSSHSLVSGEGIPLEIADVDNGLVKEDVSVFSKGKKEQPEGDNDEEDTDKRGSSKVGSRFCTFLPRRYVITLMLFWTCFLSYCLRVVINVTIVSMTNGYDKDNQGTNATIVEKKTADFDWDGKTKGLVLGAFFYGYLMLQGPAGYFSSRFGGRLMLVCGLLGNSILTLLGPVGAKFSVYLLVVIRIVQGLISCLIVPSSYTLLSKWSPPHERSKLTTFMLGGGTAGVVVGSAVSGLLTDRYGWESAFYVQGGAGTLLCVLLLLLVSESPEVDRWISKKEFDYIHESCSGAQVKKVAKVPWKQMSTSIPFWALIVSHFCNNWGFYTLLVELPSYLSSVHKFNVASSGLITAAPYLAYMVVGMSSGALVDRIRRKYLSTTTTRKLFNAIGLGLQALFLLVISFTENTTLVVAGFIFAIGSGGIVLACFLVNPFDIAPRYAGLLIGISNSIATLPGAISPLIVGVVTKEHTQKEWRIVFLLAAALYIFGIVEFTLFGSGEKQPWADYGLESKNEDEIDKILA